MLHGRNPMVIERFHSNYFIKGKMPPQVIRDRLDRIAGTLLAEEIDLILSRVLQNNSSLVFIKKINIDLIFNLLKMDDKAIAKFWAAEIVSGITKKLQSTKRPYLEPPGESNVVVFQDKAEYLACFIHDLLMGAAWDRWYFQGFRDLSTISVREIIKLIFQQNPDIAEDILKVLAGMEFLDSVLEEFSDKDIEVIYSNYLRAGYDSSTTVDDKNYKKLIQLISEIMRNRLVGLSSDLPRGYKSCLKIYLLFLKRYPEFKSKAFLKWAIEDIIFNKSDTLLTSETKIPDASKKFVTPYGGLFLLVRPILELKLMDLIKQSRFNYFLFFLALKITNQKIPNQINIDPALFLFAGLDNSVSIKNLKGYPESMTFSMNEEFLKSLIKALQTLKEQKAHSLDYINIDGYSNINFKRIDFETVVSIVAELILKIFARRLRGFEKSSSTYIFENFLNRPSGILLNEDLIHVKLSKRPLDVILRMSILLEDINRVTWINNRDIRFTLEW